MFYNAIMIDSANIGERCTLTGGHLRDKAYNNVPKQGKIIFKKKSKKVNKKSFK